jgi:hypothetical protein
MFKAEILIILKQETKKQQILGNQHVYQQWKNFDVMKLIFNIWIEGKGQKSPRYQVFGCIF